MLTTLNEPTPIYTPVSKSALFVECSSGFGFCSSAIKQFLLMNNVVAKLPNKLHGISAYFPLSKYPN